MLSVAPLDSTAVAPGLTGEEYRVWAYYAGHLGRHGYTPSVKAVAASLGYSSRALAAALAAVVRCGYLRARPPGGAYEVPGLAEHLAPVAMAYLSAFRPAGEGGDS